MVILGLGSNIGDRYGHLRHAIDKLDANPHLTIEVVSPVYESEALLPENAPLDWDNHYLNLAVTCQTLLSPDDLLKELKTIEATMGREYYARWSPRIIDIDILAWDDLSLTTETLEIPHIGLEQRPFALWPLCDIAPNWVHPQWQKPAAEVAEQFGSRFTGLAPLKTTQVNASLSATEIAAIVNISPDSFTGDGQLYAAETAVKKAQQCVADGATIIDIGAAATNPHVEINQLSIDEEWQRLQPVLQAIKQANLPAKISLDCFNPVIASKAFDEIGFDWLNDQSGLDNPDMREFVKRSGVDVIIMHHLGLPTSKTRLIPKDQDPVATVYAWAEARIQTLVDFGIKKEKIIMDVGIGFGKDAEQSVALLKNIAHFHQLGVRLMVGHSRKSFLNLITDKPFAERDLETAVVTAYLARQNVHYVRVHDVANNDRAKQVASLFY